MTFSGLRWSYSPLIGLSGQWAAQSKIAGSESRLAIGNLMDLTSAHTI